MLVLLILASVIDLALAALLIAISGFIFGGGPEGMNGSLWPAIGWSAAFASCFIAPIVGMIVLRRGKAGLGVFIAWLPAIGGLVLAFGP